MRRTTSPRPRRAALLVAPLMLGLVLPVAVVAGSGAAEARTAPPATRAAYAPNVMYPVARGTTGVKDRKLYRARKYNATQIQAPCGSRVVAAHAGTVAVGALNPRTNTRVVWVTTTRGRSTSTYSVAGTPSAVNGQIVSPGQELGRVGDMGGAKGCETLFAIRSQWGTLMNPSSWLNKMVGHPMSEQLLFGNRGFTIATFNVLGASHTDAGGSRYGTAASRMPKAVDVLRRKAIDVAGLQELQRSQYDQLLALAGSTYASYSGAKPNRPNVLDTENSVIWRKSAFDLVSAEQLQIPYFNGNPRNIPVVQLRERASGRSFYLINTHNPANTGEYPHQEKWRAQAIAIERQKIIDLRATGLPVFLTGDLNDRNAAYCPLSAGKLMLSADTVPSMTCAPPKSPWIDWVLAAGPARFTSYERDFGPKNNQGVTDHPVVTVHAHLAPPG